jgi:O-antigen/teichoic acid export membrane protein
VQVRRGRLRLAGHGAAAPSAAPTVILPPSLRVVFATAAPFILMTTFYLGYSQGIVAIVEHLLGPDDAATYNVAFLVLSAVYLAPSVVYTKFLVSKIFRWWAQDRPMFVATLHVGVATQFVLGMIAMVIVLIAAPVVVPLLFGARYAAAVPVIMVLAPAIPIRFVQHSYASAFYSPQHMWRKVSYMGIAAALSLGLNVVLTARIGLTGAALSSVGAELALLLLFFWGTARYIDGVDVWATFNPGVLRQSLVYIRAARAGVS